VLPTASPNQQVLVYLVGAIRVMPIDTLVQTVSQVVKQPPSIQGARKVSNHLVVLNKMLQRLVDKVVESGPICRKYSDCVVVWVLMPCSNIAEY
jgi:hypothetical protein